MKNEGGTCVCRYLQSFNLLADVLAPVDASSNVLLIREVRVGLERTVQAGLEVGVAQRIRAPEVQQLLVKGYHLWPQGRSCRCNSRHVGSMNGSLEVGR